MNRALTAFVAGLSLVGIMAVTGLVWPIASGYLWGRPGDTPIPEQTFDRTALNADLATAGFALGDDAHVRIYKREHLLEVWMRSAEGRFVLFRAYEICTYSGGLGPKLAEGDRQAPEGFYRVARKQLNPNSRHHLAFNIGFPNALDQALGRTGSYLMVHGGCSSVGCYAMTDAQIDEIYAIIEAALDRGQQEVDVSIFPFRMTETALQTEAGNQWSPFWRNLKLGADLFDLTGAPPRVAACAGSYVFGGEQLGSECTPITGWV
ncbi:MAG: murein L,D-transpeptidase [Hyphomicrobiales bacterium]|nr:MAG: murein L,D-transpeptidase [Hyphomicrobiales bacterium]